MIKILLFLVINSIFLCLADDDVDEKCLRCICQAASNCDPSVDCNDKLICGPFLISTDMWKETGKIVKPEDDPTRPHAFEDCTFDFDCAGKIVKSYVTKFKKDCNADGRITCMDYAKIHHFKKERCTIPLGFTPDGEKYLSRLRKCLQRNQLQ